MNPEQFAAVNKASVDTLFGLAGQALQGAERLAQLNLQTVKTLLAEAQESGQSALSAKDLPELIQLQTALLQAAPPKALAYGRQVREIFDTLGAAQRAAIEKLAADTQARFLDTLKGALSNAPGSEPILAIATSAVAAANNAYEGVNKASKQVSDAVAANVETISETVPATSLAKIEG